jgi:hypothetical protein
MMCGVSVGGVCVCSDGICSIVGVWVGLVVGE